MTLVQSPDGPIETNLPAEDVTDLQVTPKAEPATVPAEAPKEPEPQTPAAPAKAEDKPTETVKSEPAVTPEAPKPGKAKPIANLLSKLNEEREARETAERRASEAEAKLNQPKPTEAPAVTPTEPKSDTEVEDLIKKHGITDGSLIKDIIAAARKGLESSQPQALPKEIENLLAERKAEAEQKAEMSAFDNRATKLASVFKDEPIAEHKDKLLELAYSTDKAPDGERYCDKELSELYFSYIKPTVEPGKVSAEPTRRAPAKTQVIDFQEILDRDDPKDIEAMDENTFEKYNKWMTEKQGNVPIRRGR